MRIVRSWLCWLTTSFVLACVVGWTAAPAFAADTVNAYSIWPENWARPMFEEF